MISRSIQSILGLFFFFAIAHTSWSFKLSFKGLARYDGNTMQSHIWYVNNSEPVRSRYYKHIQTPHLYPGSYKTQKKGNLKLQRKETLGYGEMLPSPIYLYTYGTVAWGRVLLSGNCLGSVYGTIVGDCRGWYPGVSVYFLTVFSPPLSIICNMRILY